jgi:hypothetical protein
MKNWILPFLAGAVALGVVRFVLAPLNHTTHYHANYVEPYWKDYMVYKATVETHIFYREEPKTVASL